MLVQWKYGSSTWVSLKDMKESYPVQVAKYCVQSRMSAEPAFAWWVPYVLKKRNRIIAKVKSKYWIRTHTTLFRSRTVIASIHKVDL